MWLDGQITFSIFDHLKHWKCAQYHKQFANVCSKFGHILNEPSNICKSRLKFCLSGTISQNLVTQGFDQKSFVTLRFCVKICQKVYLCRRWGEIKRYLNCFFDNRLKIAIPRYYFSIPPARDGLLNLYNSVLDRSRALCFTCTFTWPECEAKKQLFPETSLNMKRLLAKC